MGRKYRDCSQFKSTGLGLGWLLMLLVGCSGTSEIKPVNSPDTLRTPLPTTTPMPSVTTTTQSQPAPTQPVPNPSTSVTSLTNVKNLEDNLRNAIVSAADLAVQSVNCSSKTELNLGDRLECQVLSNNQTFTVAVQITNSNRQFQWSTKGLLLTSKLETFIQEQIKARSGVQAIVECGDLIRTAKPKDRLECKATDAQQRSRTVQILVKDLEGQVEISLR